MGSLWLEKLQSELETKREKLREFFFSLPECGGTELRKNLIYQSLRDSDRRAIRVERVLKTKITGYAVSEQGVTNESALIEISLRPYMTSGIGTGRAQRAEPTFRLLTEEFFALYGDFADYRDKCRKLETEAAETNSKELIKNWTKAGISLAEPVEINRRGGAATSARIVRFIKTVVTEDSNRKPIAGFVFRRLSDDCEFTKTAQDFEGDYSYFLQPCELQRKLNFI